VPLYEDLVRRALQARERAAALGIDARRTRELSSLMRKAHKGEVLLRHCAWCGRLEVGGEWLRLEALGEGQRSIISAVIERSSHGICPDCFAKVSWEADTARAGRRAR
jgi:hypothetical protein